MEVGNDITKCQKKMIKKLNDLEVYVKAYDFGMKIFEISKFFPKEEMYSLTSQIIRSSRSISANISEGWAKRAYENVFKQHLIHALGSSEETRTWLDFSKDCKYISKDKHKTLIGELESIGKMITQLHKKWKSY